MAERVLITLITICSGVAGYMISELRHMIDDIFEKSEVEE